jgi:hypothetical protein
VAADDELDTSVKLTAAAAIATIATFAGFFFIKRYTFPRFSTPGTYVHNVVGQG